MLQTFIELSASLFRRNIKRTNLIIIVFSAIIVCLFYFFFANDSIVKDLKASSEAFKQKEFKIYTGDSTGTYSKLGNALFSNSKEHDLIVNQERTKGGGENITKIVSKQKSFSFVQEELIKNNNLLTENIRVISPLYTERLHIIYNKEEYCDKVLEDAPENLILNSRTNKSLLKFFSKSRISIGPVGSGTRVISSYLLADIKKQMMREGVESNNLEISNLTMTEGFRKLSNDSLEVMMVIAGAPVKKIKELLQNKKYGLIGIDPDLVAKLNKEYNINLTLTDFKDPYKNPLATCGSYCYLIASNDISDNDINSFLELLSDNKVLKDFKNQMGIGVDQFSPLDEIGIQRTKEDFFKNSNIWKNSIIKSVFLFIVLLLMSIVFLTALCLHLFSTWKKNNYYNELQSVLFVTLDLKLKKKRLINTEKQKNDLAKNVSLTLPDGFRRKKN